MAPSATAPVQRALDRTAQVLFRPFHLETWLTLGFCAFLAGLGNATKGSLSWSQNFEGSGSFEGALDWLRAHWAEFLAIAALVGLAGLVLGTLLLWLQARGRFMLLDGVARGRGAVRAPWTEYRAEASSAFGFKLVLVGAAFILSATLVTAFVALHWTALSGGNLESVSFGLFLLLVAALAGVGLVVGLIDLLLDDFVVPAMYARRIGVLEAWGVVRADLLGPYPGAVVLYLLMRLLLSIVSGVLVMILILGTLCVAACFLAIPYVGTVLLLPLIVFKRAYSLYFLGQLGEPWRLVRPVGQVGPVEPVEPTD